MKYVLNIVSVVLLAWIVGGGSTGYIHVRPITPSADVPVWGQEDPARARARDDVNAGLAELSEDDQKRKDQVIFLFGVVKDDPCNKEARKELATLLTSYMKDLKKTFAGDDAQSRYEHSVNLKLNEEISDILVESFQEGYLTKDDFPFLARVVMGPFVPNNEGPSACDRWKEEMNAGAEE